MKDPAGTLFVILVIAFSAPLIVSLTPWLRLPALVLEILFGILVGPDVLDLVAVSEPISLLSQLGIATLIFLAGFEVDPARLRGRPVRLALGGWGLSIVIGLAAGAVLQAAGVISSELYVGLALTTTALGTLLPILRDAGILPTPFGTHVLAVGSVGEFGPIIAVALVLSGTGAVRSVEALVAFGIVAVVAVALAARPTPPRFQVALAATLRSSGQLYIRLAMVLIGALALAAAELGLDMLLGAFTAGIVFRLVTVSAASEAEVEQIEVKLEALALGFVIPVFFVVTGIQYDLDALLGSPTALLKLPLFVALLLVARGLPTLLYRKDLPEGRDRLALAFFSATGLPLIVVITTLGLEADQIRSTTAAALVGAGMVSVVLYPLLGSAALGRDRLPAPAVDVEEDVPGSVPAVEPPSVPDRDPGAAAEADPTP